MGWGGDRRGVMGKGGDGWNECGGRQGTRLTHGTGMGKTVLLPAGQRTHAGRAVRDGLGKGHAAQPPDPNPLSPVLSGEEGRDASCQADSYRGSFCCSWTGPRSAVFRARLTHRWVSQPPARPRGLPTLTLPSCTATAPSGTGCQQRGTAGSSTPTSRTPPSAPSQRSCALCSCASRGSRTPPSSTSPSISLSVILVSSAHRRPRWGSGCREARRAAAPR